MEDDVLKTRVGGFSVLFIIQKYKQCLGGCGWNIHRTDTWSLKKKKNNCVLSTDPDKIKKEGKQVIKKGDNYQNVIDLWQWSKCPKDPNAVKYVTTHKTTQRAFIKVHLQTRVHSEGEGWRGWGGAGACRGWIGRSRWGPHSSDWLPSGTGGVRDAGIGRGHAQEQRGAGNAHFLLDYSS